MIGRAVVLHRVPLMFGARDYPTALGEVVLGGFRCSNLAKFRHCRDERRPVGIGPMQRGPQVRVAEPLRRSPTSWSNRSKLRKRKKKSAI